MGVLTNAYYGGFLTNATVEKIPFFVPVKMNFINTQKFVYKLSLKAALSKKSEILINSNFESIRFFFLIHELPEFRCILGKF